MSAGRGIEGRQWRAGATGGRLLGSARARPRSAPRNQENGNQVPSRRSPISAVGVDFRRRVAALNRGLDAIAAPALILSPSRRILTMNAAARAELASNYKPSGGSLADTSANGARLAVGKAARWELTPLEDSGSHRGFLAIRRSSSRAEAPGEKLRTAKYGWGLTRRQGEVLGLIARGLTNERIADALGIAVGTVEFHVARIFDKVGANNRATLMVRCCSAEALLPFGRE